ncbi:apolipoprotein L6-like [Mobula hypostoma]|uniref:apolipoprotein L6-like n=1 Tax=Mobula hypostoma TaxID=723540 RepID=UPI002FC3CBD6
MDLPRERITRSPKDTDHPRPVPAPRQSLGTRHVPTVRTSPTTSDHPRPVPAPRQSLGTRHVPTVRTSPTTSDHPRLVPALQRSLGTRQVPTVQTSPTPSGEAEDGVVLIRSPKDELASTEVEKSYADLERFCIIFPMLEKQIERSVQELREVAASIDKVHHRASVASAVGTGTSALGGGMLLAGLLTAPFTGGTSLLLTGAAMVGGLTASSASVTETLLNRGHQQKMDEILERYNSSSWELMDCFGVASRAIQRLAGFSQEEIAVGLAKRLGIRPISVGHNGYVLVSSVLASQSLAQMSSLQRLATEVSAMASSLQGGRLLEGASRLQTLLRGTPRLVSGSAQVARLALSSACVAWDVYSLATEMIDLSKGSKTELSQRVLDKAAEIEGKLGEFQDIYKDISGVLTCSGHSQNGRLAIRSL